MVETMAVESGPTKVMIYAEGCSGIRMRKFAEINFLDGPKVGHSYSLFGMEDVGLEWTFLKGITIIPMFLHEGDTHSFNAAYIFLSFLLFILYTFKHIKKKIHHIIPIH